ncbi:MAG: hypothetical protein KDB52_02650 [Solirubrobacterales bacterium]|nr:hypothetical protein [Solirubrobacterales bacterium]
MKKLVAIFVALMASFAMVASAQAADETVVGTTDITSLGGPLYKEKAVPVNMEIHAEVTTPVSSPKVNPLKNTKLTFPKGVSFNPNNKKTPPCTDDKLSTTSNLADPEGVVAACPKSIVGTGVSTIIIAKINNNPNTVISDPILILFNAGTDSQGRAMLKVYGYSKYTNVGILMHGTLVGQVLDLAVPVLSNDSAVKLYTFNMPGPVLDRPELGINVKGLDSNYVQATCADGVWKTNSEFILGERTYPGGVDTTPETTVVSPETEQNCVGQAGKAKLALKATGPKSVKSGKKGSFKVTVTNSGTASAKNVKVTATGGGKGSAGTLKPGAKKTVTVKTKVTGRKGSKKTLTFSAGGSKAKIKVTVK